MSKKGNRFDYTQTVQQGSIEKPAVAEVTEEKVMTAEPELLAVPALPSSLLRSGSVDALRNPSAYAQPPQRRGQRGPSDAQKRTDLVRAQLNVRILPELKRAAAGLAGLQGMTLGDVVEAALIAYLEQARNRE